MSLKGKLIYCNFLSQFYQNSVNATRGISLSLYVSNLQLNIQSSAEFLKGYIDGYSGIRKPFAISKL